MQFSLTGFSQSANVRTYRFEGRLPGEERRSLTVGVDIALARHYAISLQELPLLCLDLLEEGMLASDAGKLMFSEEQMQALADRREAAKRVAAMKHKAPRRPRPQTTDAENQGYSMRSGRD